MKDSSGTSQQERWSTKGAIILPFIARSEQPASVDSNVAWIEHWFGPAVAWNVVDTNALKPDEVEELQFSAPWKMVAGMNSETFEGFEFVFKPYYHTDWGFDGATIGASAAFDPVIRLSERFRIGDYNDVFGETSAPSFLEDLAYRIRVVPKIAYDRVAVGGNHTTRAKGDDWLRVGAKAEVVVAPWGEDGNIELKAAYEFFEGISGEETWSDLFTGSLTYWFPGKNYGLSLKYEAGETPVSEKNVDSITFGVDVKY